jgi:hypothetical protein
MALGVTLTTVLSKTVPAGNYVISAKTDLFNDVVNARSVFCELHAAAGMIANSRSIVTLAPDGAGGDTQAVPVEVTVNIPSTATVSLQCQLGNGGAGDVEVGADSELTLIHVGTIS